MGEALKKKTSAGEKNKFVKSVAKNKLRKT
jgi:hypothetical protein